MSDLKAKFEQAAKDVHSLAERPDNDTLLRLYALYKQGAEGDVSGPKPGFFDFVGTAKYEAWAKLAGTSQDDAMKKYVDLVKKLVTQSQHTFLLVYARKPDQPLNHVLSLLSHIFECQEKIHLAVFAGEHATAEKLLRTLDEKFVKNDEPGYWETRGYHNHADPWKEERYG